MSRLVMDEAANGMSKEERFMPQDIVTRSPSSAPGSSSARTRVGGVVAVAVTPCRGEGVIDPVAMGLLCAKLASAGCDGIFVAGSTGEMSLLGEEERRTLTSAARNATESDVAIYSGVTGLGLKQTIQYARNAAQDGADVAVVMAPFYFSFSQVEIVSYMRAVAEASPIPVAIYHHPRMPTPLSFETIALVAEHPNVVAVKHTSTSVEQVKSLVEAVAGRNITVLQGNELFLAESYFAGATGGMVTALAGVVPEWHVDLYRSLQASDQVAAQKSQQRILDLWQMFRVDSVQESISTFVFSLKSALQRRGWLDQLDAMMPGFVPSEELKREIARHLRIAGVPDGSRILQADEGAVRVDAAGVSAASPHTPSPVSRAERN